VGRAPHGLGARHPVDCGGQGRYRAFLNRPDDLADCAPLVTPATRRTPPNTLPACLPSTNRYSPPSLATIRAIHRLGALFDAIHTNPEHRITYPPRAAREPGTGRVLLDPRSDRTLASPDRRYDPVGAVSARGRTARSGGDTTGRAWPRPGARA